MVTQSHKIQITLTRLISVHAYYRSHSACAASATPSESMMPGHVQDKCMHTEKERGNPKKGGAVTSEGYSVRPTTSCPVAASYRG